MKNAIKKLTAALLTATIIAGTSVSTMANACKPQHDGYRRYEYTGDWHKVSFKKGDYCKYIDAILEYDVTFYVRVTEIRCVNCDKAVKCKYNYYTV